MTPVQFACRLHERFLRLFDHLRPFLSPETIMKRLKTAKNTFAQDRSGTVNGQGR